MKVDQPASTPFSLPLTLSLLLTLSLWFSLFSLCFSRFLQVDMLDSQEEVDAVLQFVSSNASKLLQVRVLMVEIE